jgi:hypothetical protein
VRRVSGTHEASLIKPNKSQDELENCWSDSQCPTEIQKEIIIKPLVLYQPPKQASQPA